MANDAPKVLALDMGFGHTGMVLAAVNSTKPSGFDILRVGCVHTDEVKKRTGKIHASDVYKSDLDVARAGYIYTKLKEFLAGTRLAMLVSESPSGGGKSAIAIRSMGIATGVLGVVTALMPNVVFVNVQPDAVKRTVGGSISAGKEGVERAVRAWFSEYEWPKLKKDSEHILDAAGALLTCRDSDAYRRLAGDDDGSGTTL